MTFRYLEIDVNLPQTDSDSLDKLNEFNSIAEVNFIEDDEDSLDLENRNKFDKLS